MREFTFKAASLFDANASVAGESEDLHDAPATALDLAKRRPLARWLVSELTREGLRPSGPHLDEGGWIMTLKVPGGEIYFVIYGKRGDETTYVVDVVELGSVARDLSAILERILRRGPQITNLTVR